MSSNYSSVFLVLEENILNLSVIRVLLLQWLVVRYAILNLDIIHEAIRIAKEEGLFVSLDLASFEVMCFCCFFLLTGIWLQNVGMILNILDKYLKMEKLKYFPDKRLLC